MSNKTQPKESNKYGSRLREMTAVLRKHGITGGLTPEKLRLILEDLGPTYIKLGQIMSLHSDILPKSYCEELMRLHSEVTPMPFEQVASPTVMSGTKCSRALMCIHWDRHQSHRSTGRF